MSRFRSFMPAQGWPDTQGLIQGLRKVGKLRERGNNSYYERRRRASWTERGARGDAKAVPKAVKRQLAQRCVCPIFSFPHAHFQLKQLLENLHTKRLQHHCSCRQKKKKKSMQQENLNFYLAQVFQL